MIDKINSNINFTSSIVFNKTLDKGFNQAVIHARMENKRLANRFANAINCLKNDGKDYVYSIEPGQSAYEPKNRIYLMRNGAPLRSEDGFEKTGDNIIHIIIDFVKSNFHSNLDIPGVKFDSNLIKTPINNIKTNISKIQKFIDKKSRLNNDIFDIQEHLKNIENAVEEGRLLPDMDNYCVKKLYDIKGNVHYGEKL